MIETSVTDGLCVLRLDNPPVNTLSFELLEELCAAVRRANEDSNVRKIMITGSAKHFSAGADVTIFRAIETAEQAMETSQKFQQAFLEIEDSVKPVFAAVAGNMMGGALELAMACHARICTPQTKFCMPEVNLGINPGAGGTQRLPRLVGAEKALDMLLGAKTLKAGEALAIGLVDAICAAEKFPMVGMERSNGWKTREREAELTEEVFQSLEKRLAKVRPELIAPSRIADAVKTGLEESFEAGQRREQTAFAECMATRATRNKIYTFFATRGTGKVPELDGIIPRTIHKAAVVGMGSMGTGIAHALMIGGVPVTVIDADADILARGTGKIEKSISKRVEQGKLPKERADGMLSLLTTTTDWQDIADADLVIEAVFEDLAIKHSVIEQIEQTCSAETILASNTSTISLDELAAGMQHPERLIGLHFFNPAQTMPLVEVIRRDGTPGEVVATALKFTKAIRKTPVLVKNREGFIVNRMFVPYMKEAFRLLEEGAEAAEIDAAMIDFGFMMGPLTLIDMAGLDVLVFVSDLMTPVFANHEDISPVAVRLVQGGALGQKTGSGVYRYEKGDRTPYPREDTARIIAEVRAEKDLTPREIGRDEIIERLVLRMVNEAFYIMEEGIALREKDVDAAMVLGTGFPDFRGGVLKYAHDLGLDNITARLGKLSGLRGKRFIPGRLLGEKKGTD